MKVKNYTKYGIDIVEPQGKFRGGEDTGELDEKLYALQRRGVKTVVVDLGSMEWMNSSGLTILVHHYKKLRGNGGNLILANPNKKIEKILVTTRLMSVFQTHESVDEAVASLRDK